jgi:RNA polymerase sigma factor (sigma-70 family)
MEASALQHSARLPALAGRSPLLRLQGDEKLIALIRRGHHGAFEALVQRYQPRLLAFCRHMLGSTEDAEDVLQEVFAASFNAICADERPINARPWLYRIARNRCLNHLRRPAPSGQDSMDVFERDGGTTTADTVHKREEFRQIVSDVQDLPETQRTALLLREIDALAYDQIAEAMDTTVSSVKSLLVRARVSLAEASEARMLTCDEVRLELGQVAEGLGKTSAPARRHLRGCERCRVFKVELRKTNKALAAVYPLGPLVFLKKTIGAKLAAGGAGGAAAGGSGGAAALGGAAATASAPAAISAGLGTVASKAAAGVAAAAIVTVGAVEVRQVTATPDAPAPAQAIRAPARATHAPVVPARTPEPVVAPAAVKPEPKAEQSVPVKPQPTPVAKPASVPAKPPVPVSEPKPAPTKAGIDLQESESTVTLPGPNDDSSSGGELSSPQPPPDPAPPPSQTRSGSPRAQGTAQQGPAGP